MDFGDLICVGDSMGGQVVSSIPTDTTYDSRNNGWRRSRASHVCKSCRSASWAHMHIVQLLTRSKEQRIKCNKHLQKPGCDPAGHHEG
jgi:hypothetical protein